MRILLAADRADSAGIGTVVRGLCASLPGALPPGFELMLVGGRRDRPTPKNVVHLLRPRTHDGRLSRFAFEQAMVAAVARRADLVHQTDYRALLASRTPFLITVHDAAFLDHPQWYPPTVARFKRAMLSAALAKRPRAIVCGSEFTRRRLLEHHPLAGALDLHVIHPGVQPPPGEQRASAEDEPYFLTISTIEPRKNHLGLLDAFRRARSKGLRLRWKIAGAPGYGSRQIVSALRSADGVDVMGWVDDPTRERLYREASFVATPSHVEGFGFPPLEAMARDVATISSTGSALDETVGAASLRVDPDDVGGWEAAITRLAEDEAERARLRGLGRTWAVRFQWEQTAEEYVRLYEGLANDL